MAPRIRQIMRDATLVEWLVVSPRELERGNALARRIKLSGKARPTIALLLKWNQVLRQVSHGGCPAMLKGRSKKRASEDARESPITGEEIQILGRRSRFWGGDPDSGEEKNGIRNYVACRGK